MKKYILLLLFKACLCANDGFYYSGNGGYENNCPRSPCQTDCPVGSFRSGCTGNSTGACVACSNKPADSTYTTKGGLISDCAWTCNQAFTLSGMLCIGTSLCTKTIPSNSKYSGSNFPDCDHQCSAGYFNSLASVNPASCYPCQAGKYSMQGGTICTDCTAGTYSSAVSASCQSCPVGTSSAAVGATSQAVCFLCSAGKYTNQIGKSACENCDVGTFSQDPGSTKCYNCAANTFAASTGMATCTPCSICNTAGVYRSGCGPISAGSCSACSNPVV
jgi:hypothetical protein